MCPVFFLWNGNGPCFDYLVVSFCWGVSDSRRESIAAKLLVETYLIDQAVVTVSTVRGHCSQDF